MLVTFEAVGPAGDPVNAAKAEILLLAPGLLGESLALQLTADDPECAVCLRADQLKSHPCLVVWSVEDLVWRDLFVDHGGLRQIVLDCAGLRWIAAHRTATRPKSGIEYVILAGSSFFPLSTAESRKMRIPIFAGHDGRFGARSARFFQGF